MISYDEAINIISDIPLPGRKEYVSVESSVNRCLAEDLIATISTPGFKTSSFDGFAVCWKGTNRLDIVGEQLAGNLKNFHGSLPNHTIAVMTGAFIPDEFDTVIPIENCDLSHPGKLLIVEKPSLGHGVRHIGSDVSAGQTILLKGQVIQAHNLPVIFSQGLTHVPVYAKPTIVILTTGPELVNPGLPLPPGHIYNSSMGMLQALCTNLPAEIIDIKHISSDDPAEFQKEISNSLAKLPDLIISTGAVSMGAADFIPKVFSSLGITCLFHKVAIKPGKPIWFGTSGHTLVFGLPGNPVSTLICWHLFVRRVLGKKAISLKLPIADTYIDNHSQLTRWLKASISSSGVSILAGQESYQVRTFSQANCFVMLPPNSSFHLGDFAEVLLL